MINDVLNEIKSFADEQKAKHLSTFFKTAQGEYAEGDKFYGVTSPQVRLISGKYFKDLALSEIDELIKNPYHEVRSTALIILTLKYTKASKEEKEQIFNLYLNNIDFINNWDLVDISAPNIIGDYVYNFGSKDILKELAKKDHLWSQRISIVASLYFIKKLDLDFTFEIAEFFLSHKHDLIHKASGWMLREAGKRDINRLYEFLDENAPYMPRTMLRYSIEKIYEEKRKEYLSVKFFNLKK